MREQQGKWPVFFLSFAGVKGSTIESALMQMKSVLFKAFARYPELYRSEIFEASERKALLKIEEDMSDDTGCR